MRPKFAFQRYQWRCKCRLRRGHSKMLRVLQTVCIELWTAKGHSTRCPTETAGCRCYGSCWAGCWFSSGICVRKRFFENWWWCVHAAVLDWHLQSLNHWSKVLGNQIKNKAITFAMVQFRWATYTWILNDNFSQAESKLCVQTNFGYGIAVASITRPGLMLLHLPTVVLWIVG